jgi:predicted dinucleotide-binding enzyme
MARFGVLGTGTVGQTLASKLASLGHEVMMGSRQAGNEKAVAWAKEAGRLASEGTFADAAGFGEDVVNATAGSASLAALAAAGAETLAGKVLVDVANPLDFSAGMPPTLTVCNTDSLAEQIQRAFPETSVVKALNTVNAGVMVEPESCPVRTSS